MASRLTSEELKQIEERRRNALEKLSRKRKPENTCVASDPKRPVASSSRPESTIYKKPLTAVLSLVSANRFTIDVPYDKGLIDMFKGIPSRKYDSEARVWTFGLEHYSKLVQQIRSTSFDHVTLQEIPRCILQLFTKPSVPPSCSSNIQSRVPSDLYSSLMQFQQEGLKYSIERGGRVLLADDMGLGKTIQAISVACYYRSEWPILVICPASVKMYWAESFNKWVTDLSSDDINVVMTTGSSIKKSFINIISYDMLVLSFKNTENVKFNIVIADESHFLKNYKTARSKTIIPLLKRAKRAILLSGTPALSRPIELYTQIIALDVSFKMKLTQFGLRYCNGVKNKFGWDLSGCSNMQELLLYMQKRIMIRRMKTDVLSQLPSKRRQMVILDPSLIRIPIKDKESFEQMNEAKKMTEIDKTSSPLLPLFSKTALIKIDAVCQYILDMLEGKRKLVLFAHHKVMMEGICQSLEQKNYKYIKIDGSTSSSIRSTLCDTFQYDQNCLVAVLSITAASTGLTLTSASTVIFAELFWNPGVLVQAEDRVYRIGQHSAVNIHYLVAKNTIDDYLWPLVNRKLDVLNKAGLASVNFNNSDTTTLASTDSIVNNTKATDTSNITNTDSIVSNTKATDTVSNSNSNITVDDTVSIVSDSKDNNNEHLVDEDWFSTLDDDELMFLDNI